MAAPAVKGLPEDLVNEVAELFTVILASATDKQRTAGYMCDSGKDMNPHELLDAFEPQLAALGTRIFSSVTLAKYSRNQEDFLKRVSEKTVDTAARTQPCWRCGEVWSERKPNCGCVKCKNNPKYSGSDLGAGTNYEPPTCLVYAASFKVFIHAAVRTLMYRYAYPRYELYGKVYKRNDQGFVVVDEAETALFLEQQKQQQDKKKNK
jgi:hypothetical protein